MEALLAQKRKIGSGEKEKMEEAFNNMYHIVVDNPVFPCDPLTNRIWRNFRHWQMSVTTTSQMKSLLYDQAPKTSERTQLGEHTTVISELPNAFVPKHVVEYCFGLRTLIIAWSRCGNYLVDSKSKPGTHVLMMPWDTALNYADCGLRIVTSSGIAPSEQLQWWDRKDRITRGAIAGLVRQRWPAQEALEKALADTNTDWTVVRGVEVKVSTRPWNRLTRGWSWEKVPVEAKVGFAIRNGVVSFVTTQTETVDLSFFPTTMTREPGTAKSSTRPRVMTTLRRDNDALETRHLSHLRARNSVVLSTLLKVVLMIGIARKKRYTVVTSPRRPMAVCVSPQTTEDISTVHRKPASTPQWGGGGHRKFYQTVLCQWSRQLAYNSDVPNIWRGLDEAICCRSLGASGSTDWLLSSTCGLALEVLCMHY